MLVTTQLTQLTDMQTHSSSGFAWADGFLLCSSAGSVCVSSAGGVVLNHWAVHFDRALGTTHPSPEWITFNQQIFE